MFRTIKKYTRVYRHFVSTSIALGTSFRLHFILLILMDLLFYFSSLASVSFIFDHVNQIGPWQRTEFMFFVCFMLAVDHLHMTFVSESFWELSHQIRTGSLDFLLLKPIGTVFHAFLRFIRPASALNIFVTWGLLIYYGQAIGLLWWQWILMPILMLLSLTLLVTMEILVSCSMFVTIESFGINFLRMQLQQLARWPDFVYRLWARRILTFGLPVILVGSAPVHWLLSPFEFRFMAYMFLAIIIMWVIIAPVWRFALSRYESASS